MLAAIASASQSLLYLEGQGIVGYRGSTLIYYSQDPNDGMQQSSLGVDYLQKLSGNGSDIGTVAIQGRLSMVPGLISSQLYNAYLKFKTSLGDVWVGHDKPAMGLSSWADNHAWLLPVLAMKEFGYDRDWGIGLKTQREDGDDSYALTTGSGMGFVSAGNYLLSARRSWGVFSQDNTTLGLSVAYGNAYDVMGYQQMMPAPMRVALVGIDHALNWDNFEWLGDVYWGQKDNQLAYAFMGRLSSNLMEENRLKVELQKLFTESYGQQLQETSVGITYLISSDLTGRLLYQQNQLVVQCYYYSRLF